jgi:carbamoyl-phosphate synthase large subunit
MKNREAHLIINTPSGRIPRKDEIVIRSSAVMYNIPVITTVAGAIASCKAIEVLRREDFDVKSIQEYHHFLNI